MSIRGSHRFGMLISVVVFTVYSVSFSILGPSLPKISEIFQLAPLEIGAIASAAPIGFALASFPAGVASDKIGRRKVFSLGLVLIVAGLFAVAFSYSFYALFFTALLLGAGGGMFEGGINPFVSDLYPGREGFAINFLHVFWGVGSFIGPSIVAVLLGIYGLWRSSFLLVSIATLAAVFLSLTPRPNVSRTREKLAKDLHRSISARYGEFLGLMLAAFMIWGVEISILNWLPLFLTSERGFPVVLSALALALFQLLLAAGRLFWGAASTRLGLATTIRVGAIGGGLLLLGALMVQEQIQVFLLLSSSSFFIASVLPTLIALGAVKSKSAMGAGSGIVLSIGTIGSIVFPLAIGFIAQYTSIHNGFILVCATAMLISAIRLGRQSSSAASETWHN